MNRHDTTNLTRRAFVISTAAFSTVPLLAACARKDDALQKLWTQWQADWRTMETIATQRGWDVTPLKIAPPATDAAVDAVERHHGLKVPLQLRRVLTELSAHVAFGWRIPSHERPMERIEHLYPTDGGIRDFVWKLDHMDQHAIGNFLGWKRDIAGQDLSEAPNAPEMWDNHFPIADLPNGDMLSIDVSHPDPTQQPVRYFSHELEGLHAHALAPDFLSFITTYSALGCAGNTQDEWIRFIDQQDAGRRVSYLTATSVAATRWLAWRASPEPHQPDEPPPAIVERTAADRALLDAARSNSLTAVNRALMAGAQPDCVPSSDWQMDKSAWDQEFSTPITYATRHNNTAMIDRLLKAGATLNTRFLPLNAAVKESSLATVQWLIANGARVNGWKDQRYWPLHDLVVTRGQMAAKSREDYRKELVKQAQFGDASFFDDLIAKADDEATRQAYRDAKSTMAEQTRHQLAEVDKRLEIHIDSQTYLQMLEALLQAGAKPDAPWDNGITMLGWGGVETAKVLLAHGADPNARDAHGWTVLHRANAPAKVRLLVAHGADINARATPPPDDLQPGYTPLQSALMSARDDNLALVTTYLELGADPKLRDNAGRSTLAYCFSIETFKLILAYGLDARDLQPGGQTLLHNLVTMSNPPRADFPDEVAFFKYLLELGIDINAQDEKGQTMLHLAAARESYAQSGPNYRILIANGADTSIRNNDGKRAFDLVAKSLKPVRAVLQ